MEETPAKRIERFKNDDSTPETSFEEPKNWEPLSSKFSDIVKNHAFVDKTLLIKKFLEDKDSKVAITTPSGFGKTVNVLMLKHFLELIINPVNGKVVKTSDTDNYKLFFHNKLKITEEKMFLSNHFGTYPVIYLNFQVIPKLVTPITPKQKYQYAMFQAMNEHSHLLACPRLFDSIDKLFKCLADTSGENIDIETDLEYLIKLLHANFKEKVVVLIDAYDSAIVDAIIKSPDEISTVQTHCSIVRSILRQLNVEQIKRVFITGTSILAFECLNVVNDLKKHVFWEHHPYAPFHGISSKELNSLLNKLNVKCKVAQDIYKSYKGYTNLNKSVIYNTFCIANFLQQKHKYDFHYQEIRKQFNLEKMLQYNPVCEGPIEHLYEGGSFMVQVDYGSEVDWCEQFREILFTHRGTRNLVGKNKRIIDSRDAILSFLLDIGYLTVCYPNPCFMKGNYLYLHVKIPNNAIKNELEVKLNREYMIPHFLADAMKDFCP